MPDQPSPVDELKAFREMLVEKRRQLVRGALRTRDEAPLVSDEEAAEAVTVQEQIEAVGRAIEDEQSSGEVILARSPSAQILNPSALTSLGAMCRAPPPRVPDPSSA